MRTIRYFVTLVAYRIKKQTQLNVESHTIFVLPLFWNYSVDIQDEHERRHWLQILTNSNSRCKSHNVKTYEYFENIQWYQTFRLQAWPYNNFSNYSWWRHQMETFFTGGFPSERPVTRSFVLFFDLRLNKPVCKQSRRRWFQTPWRSLWRHCNVSVNVERAESAEFGINRVNIIVAVALARGVTRSSSSTTLTKWNGNDAAPSHYLI